MLSKAMAAFAPGEVLAGRFELGGRLGAGGIAEVYAARDRVGGSDVAIKVLHPHLAEDAGLVSRFRREMSVTRGLDHPGIVRVFDLHDHHGVPFLSMELLEGRTLAALLQRKPLPVAEARRIAREIGAALRAAHQAGVIHRDLKPQNVFITDQGVVKLLDFGLARVAGQTRLTAQSRVLGTPGYIAPEIYAGQRADARADLYSLGVTFYEMLTGRPAFGTSDPYEVVRLQRETTLSAQLLNPLVSETDEAVLRRALHPDPEQRYLDAGQMLQALGGKGVAPPPLTPPPLTAGEYDVIVHYAVKPLDLVLRRRRVGLVLERLGARAPPAWKLRLAGAGQAVLINAASRRTAEAAASLCADQGLPATVRCVGERPRSADWVARLGGPALALASAAVATLVAAALQEHVGGLVTWASAGAAIGYALSWGLQPAASAAPLAGLPAHDSGIRRLAQGIARRAQRLQHGLNHVPADRRGVAGELAQAAAAGAAVAERFSRQGEATGNPEPARHSPGALRSLDLLTSRLLEVATFLDDALVLAGAQPRPAHFAPRQLQDGLTLARDLFPRLRELEPRATPRDPQERR